MAILKKLKKGLKKAAKVAIPVGAAFLAAKAMKDRKAKKELGDTETTSRMGSEFTKSTKPTIAQVSNTPKKKATPKVYQDDIMKGGSGTKYVDKYEGTPLRRLQNSPLRTDGLGDMDMKDGGRANYKSGGKVKGCGKALRGYGKAMKGNR